MKTALLVLSLVAFPFVAQARPAWTFSTERLGASLTLVDPDDGGEGDNPSLTCSRGRFTALAFADGDHFPLHTSGPQSMIQLNSQGRPGPWPSRLTISSGAVSVVAVGRAEYGGEMNGTTLVRGTLPMTAPVVRNFTATGRIRLVAYGQDANLPPVPRPLLARFTSACRG